MGTVETKPGWLGFWNRGGWWRAVLVILVYAGLYTLASLGAQLAFSAQIHPENLFSTPESVFFAVGLGVLIGSILVAIFVTTVQWWRPLFAPQPVPGSWWMWIAVAIVVIPALLRLIAMDYSVYSIGTILVTFIFAGLLVGFVEEMLTRGIAVKLLRDGGYSERVVAVLAATVFSLLHLVNAIGSGINQTVLYTLLYTFGFGICMYLVMRVTGNLVWAIVLHAITDPTISLASGGVDVATHTVVNPLLTIAGLENIVVIAFGLIAIIFIRGRVTPAKADDLA